MILPSLEINFKKDSTPGTWMMAGFFILTFFVFQGDPQKDIALPSDAKTLQEFGKTYLEILPASELSSWRSKPQNDEIYEILGRKALGDVRFIRAQSPKDARIALIQAQMNEDILSRFGVQALTPNALSWVTYQFCHAHFVHLLTNLIFFLLIAFGFERKWGTASLITVFLSGGFFGAFAFLWMDPWTAFPLVGASSGLTALLGFQVLAEQKKYLRCFYFFYPFEGGYGWIWIPLVYLIPIFFINDLSGLLFDVTGEGSSVAHAAHLGGLFWGLALAAFHRFSFSRQARNLGASYSR